MTGHLTGAGTASRSALNALKGWVGRHGRYEDAERPHVRRPAPGLWSGRQPHVRDQRIENAGRILRPDVEAAAR